jgi:protoheme IX farnesyltransferase
MAPMTRFQKLTVASAATTIVLFSVGGLVRGTGSGLGCSAWPACEPGRLFPAGAVHSLIEFSHRTLAFLAIVLIALTAIEAGRRHRTERALLLPALTAFPLVIAQAVLGGIVVLTKNDPWWVSAHFVTALALIADVVILAANSLSVTGLPREGARGAGADPRFARLAMWTVGMTGALLLVGTYVRASDSQLVFTDWPLMDGKLVPALGGAATVMFVHRVLAAGTFLLVVWTAIRTRATAARSTELVVLSTLALVLFVAQIMSGAANVWTRLKPWAVVLHVAFSVLIWSCLVALATISRRLAAHPRVDGATAASEPGPLGDASTKETLTAYVRLTKPRIIVLLLITTVPAMILATGGLPSLWLILATLLGGTIAAGSANAINMYLDRDIDEIMRRTRGRPLPAHVVTPDRVLAFGFLLGVVSFLFLSVTVNVLAATLSLSAIAFYVFVYTMWLKRTTSQNIVIGGAAGAVPALVGWAAVTGTIAAPAWLLFAIIFVWTPPHFWALAMRYQKDYATAGVPMLPVVKGEDETRRQIFLYSLVLFATTLLLVPIGRMGPVYLVTAVVLGGVFVWRALRLWRDPAPAKAWGLFKYSIVYLAALFCAVAVDALTPLGRRG